MKKAIITIYILLSVCIAGFQATGQEFAGPLRYNAFMNKGNSPARKSAAKKTIHTLTLPFFEDFTGYSAYPDSSRWTDFEVYINNEMCVSPISRGVATFDDLDGNGIPYDSFSNTAFRYADSLTSQPIDLSNNFPQDSLYLSFFYQPQGNGFYPLQQDSLQLYIKDRYGDFVLVWSDTGGKVQPFKQVMVPITDSLYFHASFQFRFVNIAALDWADAVWNLDYVRLDTNRNMNDTAVNDIGFSSDPTFLLNDYTSMPYRQFYADTMGERATQYTDSVHNNYDITQLVTYGYKATALNTGAILQPTVLQPSTAIGGSSTQQFLNRAYTTTIPLASVGIDDRVVFENTYFIQSVSPTDPSGNDTIVKEQMFDNYLAYDDGTAEKSYYLNLFPTEPGKIAVEYHLNKPDTLRGMAVYFGRQIPFPSYKTFSIYIYTALKDVNGAPADITVDSQEFYIPAYEDSINHFWVYTFDTPFPMGAGTFYAGTLQAASSADDSIYFGLDVNRIGFNHAYFNVVGAWSPSLISGAIMMRPLLGQFVSGTAVKDIAAKKEEWDVIPNPAIDKLQFEMEQTTPADYRITDMQGRTILTGKAAGGKTIDIAPLAPGMYLINLVTDGIATEPKKFIKL